MRFFRTLAVVAFGAATAGCYTLKPAAGITPVPGEVVALAVNDAGRVALGGTIGPEIAEIEGLLVGSESEEYLLSVRSVRFLRGGNQTWAGERVRIRNEHVGLVYQRQFSRTRSIALGTIVVGGFVAFLASRDLFGLGILGGEPGDPKPKPVELVRP